MTKLPILMDGSYKKIVGTIFMDDKLLKMYSENQYLVINPIVKTQEGSEPEVIGFGVYPAPPEPERPIRKRRKKKTPEWGSQDLQPL